MPGARSRVVGGDPRWTARWRAALALGCALALAGSGCGAEDAASVSAALRPDGGSRGNGGGRSHDSGIDASADAGRDAGSVASPEPDASPPLDAGAPLDAGPPLDASPPLDAGPDLDASADLDAAPALDAGADLDSGAELDSGTGLDSGAELDSGTGLDAGEALDSGTDLDAATELDAGTELDSGAPLDAGQSIDAGAACTRARRVWFDDFETGDHSRWTGGNYDEGWGNDCQSTALSTVHPRSGVYDQRSEIVCRMRGNRDHRGYGGLQFSGDTVLPDYTNAGSGMQAPHGIVTTFWTWLEAGYAFGNGTWVSLFTVNPTCDYSELPITLGLDQPDGILRAAHWWPEGASVIEPGAPSLPRGRWVRITVYLSFDTGVMHTWQDGRSVEHVTGIVRTSHLYCQWHWGLYASGDNTDIVLFEDDKIIWKLEQPWTEFSREPWLAEAEPVCGG